MMNKRIDGKNAVLIVEGNNIQIIYKNAFGELSSRESKKFEFTYDDVEDIEYKKPGISMNGFILLVLKNDDMHKIVLNKLDEYSFEITDEFVMDMEFKIEERNPKPVIAEPVKIPILTDTIHAIFPYIKKKKEEEQLEDKDKTLDKPKEPVKEKEKNKIIVTDNAVRIINKPIKVIKPKSKEEIEKDKIREELRRKIEERRKEQEEVDISPVELRPVVKKPPTIENTVLVDPSKEKPKVTVVNPETKEKEETKETVYIDTQEYAIGNKKKEEQEKEKQKEEEKKKQEEQKLIEEQKKKKDEHKFSNIFKKLNITVEKDKQKTEEFNKEPERKVVVGTVETNQKGQEKKVPIEVGIRPLKKEELEELEKKKNDIIIDELKYKLYLIESEIATLMYQLMILDKYIDNTYDKKEIERIKKQIDDLIKILEAIKKEILNKMAGKDYVANKALDVTGDDVVNIDDFKTIYVKTLDKISDFESELNAVKEKTEEKQKEVNLTEKEYEKDLKALKERQDLIAQYEDFIARSKTLSYTLSYSIANSVQERTRHQVQFIHQLREDTRILAALSAVSLATPGLNGPVSAVLTTATGLAAMRDAVIPTETRINTVKETTKVDYSRELQYSIRDAYEATSYLDKAKKDIKDIKKEVEQKYKNYPEYQEIVTEFDKLEVELARQEKELQTVLYLTRNNMSLNEQQKILILEKENENH